MAPSSRWLLSASLTASLLAVCMGQSSSMNISADILVKGMSTEPVSIFSCNYNVTGSYVASWALNGIAICNNTHIFKAEYADIYLVIGSKYYGSIIGTNIPLEHHLFNFTCRLYTSNDFVANASIPPAYETAARTMSVLNPPSNDPVCKLGLTEGSGDQPLIDVSCCVQLTREALSVSLVQRTVVWYRNTTDVVRDLRTSRQQCFKHTTEESSLSTGNFECTMQSSFFRKKRTCTFESFKPSITLSRIQDHDADLTCSHDASDIIGYTWSVDDRDVEYTLSENRKHFFTSNKDKKTIIVSCTVFTRSGYGSAKLQIIADKPRPDGLANQSIVILVGCVLAAIILLLFIVIIAYLVVIRGICICFQPYERYTERDLRRLQLERESMAHFHSLHHHHAPESVQLVIPNGGHRYHVSDGGEDDEDAPPVPGANAQFSSHLLDYADLDHGNTPSDDTEEKPAPPPQRSDNTKVEYADILKPPTTSLRDMH